MEFRCRQARLRASPSVSMFDATYSESNAYAKTAFAIFIDLLTCDTVHPIFRSELKCAFMSARLMLRMFRGPSFGNFSSGWDKSRIANSVERRLKLDHWSRRRRLTGPLAIL